MKADLNRFKAALKKVAKELPHKVVVDTQLAIGQHVYEKVILRTPVLTGHARHNWMPSINTQVTEEQEGVFGGDRTGEPITSQERLRWKAVRKELQSMPIGQTVWICNNVPYINRLEFGGYPDGPNTVNGFSKKAPQGMVGVTLIEVLEGVYSQQPKVMGDDDGT